MHSEKRDAKQREFPDSDCATGSQSLDLLMRSALANGARPFQNSCL
jgi:hypothetical protein